ncbi:MAG: glycosyltransferase [Thermoproteota archaeon]
MERSPAEKPEVSVILPAYNLEKVIKASILRTKHVLESMGKTYEIIVVNDGSSDGTYRKAKTLEDGVRVKVVNNRVNFGKGFAVKKGVEFASGTYTIFVDADLEIDPIQIGKFLIALKKADIVIASKRHPNANYEAPYIRKFLSFCFHLLVVLLTGVKVSDTQSGLKAFRTSAIKKIMKLVVVRRYAFDVEVLAVAQLLKLKIVEVPINIKIEKLFSLKAVVNMFVDLLGITYRLRVTKWYQRKLHKMNLQSSNSNQKEGTILTLDKNAINF